MHAGIFKLEKSTLALGIANGKPAAIRIPAGDTVKLIGDPRPGNKGVVVLWEGRIVTMYVEDLR